jgi:hypothetical protein
MTAIVTETARPVAVARGCRFELVKLFSAWRIRLLVVACWLVWVVSPLEAAFLALTEQPEAGR